MEITEEKVRKFVIFLEGIVFTFAIIIIFAYITSDPCFKCGERNYVKANYCCQCGQQLRITMKE